MNLGTLHRAAGISLALLFTGTIPALAVQQNATACQVASRNLGNIQAQNNALQQNNQGAFVLWLMTGIDLVGFGAAAQRLADAQGMLLDSCGA